MNHKENKEIQLDSNVWEWDIFGYIVLIKYFTSAERERGDYIVKEVD